MINNQSRNQGNRGSFTNKRAPRKLPKSTINPADLVKKGIQSTMPVYTAPTPFSELGLHQKLNAAIEKKGFKNPTQIQAETLQPLLAGRNLVGLANTGTGKTGAFLIPVIQKLLTENDRFQTLVVLPTRELALQVGEEFHNLSAGTGLSAAIFIGGTSVSADLRKLRRRNDLIIGTPGRLMDMMNQRALNLSSFKVLILDEFDRMLDMGFVRDIQKIISAMTSRKQTMLFSATVEPGQAKLINDIVKDPVRVSVSNGNTPGEGINQEIIRSNGKDKFQMLTDLVSGEAFSKVLVFAETKRMVDKISKKLNGSGLSSDIIHGNKSQNYRITVLNKFKSGKTKILVATDVAARGIDVNDVTHVINFQLPANIDSYIHRIGRTGRAGKTGHAYTFVD